MRVTKLNWPLWAGFLLSLVAFISYPVFFIRFPVTRNFPWANLALGAIAIVLLVIGARRAFASDRPRRSKIAGILVPILGVLSIGVFLLTFFVMARMLPPAKGAPQVGGKAPEFTLTDSDGKQTSLAELTKAPIDGKPVKGVLLIFYRGYW
jgi:hypothetical protein